MSAGRAQLPPHLEALRARIEGYARGYGLDGFDTVFHVLDYDELHAVAAYGGFPTRYPHWRFGMAYQRLTKGYQYGLSKIYELVINHDPAHAYLLASNMDVDQKLVMAHVYGHVDFFKHNFSFRRTSRRMIDAMANHATRVRRHADRHGVEAVEAFLDRCLSLENLIDPLAPPGRRADPPADGAAEPERPVARGLRADREYMRGYINPPAALEAEQRRLDAGGGAPRALPERPERDVMGFLLEHAPLDRWERELLALVREEALYFAPQGQTKIMNEGWATYWHTRIMTERALEASEVVDYADHHAGTLAAGPGQLNPYRLGLALWRDIEERWDKGRFGKAWEECDSLEARRRWDLHLGQGQAKLFEVRRHHSDVSFVDEFLTLEFCAAQRLFTFGWDERHTRWEVASRDFAVVKDGLLRQLTNLGEPVVEVTDANFENRGELLLTHRHDGADLRLDWARDTLRNLQALWRRPVALSTLVEGRPTLLRFDGGHHSAQAATP